MGSETPLYLPIVKFSKEDLIPGTVNWVSLRNQTCKALEDYGCFEAVHDGFPMELHNAMLSALDELFDLPVETKMKNTSEKPLEGYIGATPLVPILESLRIDYAPVRERVQDFSRLMWPDGNDSFCETIHSFTDQIYDLTKIVMKFVFESYSVETYYDSHMESTNSVLRFIKYRGPQTNESKIGMTSHTDKTFITILHQNQVNGLELKTKKGDWISFTPSKNSFVVIAGDAFLAWSNGRIHSVHHRVTIGGVDTRYSVALFTFLNGVIKCPEELVDEEHPLLFKPFYTRDLHDFFRTEEGQKAESTVKTYFGVDV